MRKIGMLLGWILLLHNDPSAQPRPVQLSYVVSMEHPGEHLYHVVLTCSGFKGKTLDFKMCAWTPGFYELIDFSGAVEHFQAADAHGATIGWTTDSAGGAAGSSAGSWRVQADDRPVITISYDVKATNPFIANDNLDSSYGYIVPGGVFMYLDQALRHPVTVQIKPAQGWPSYVATGLNALPGKPNTFYAADFDELYDSPFLMGELETLPATAVRGRPVQFIGYDLGNFDRKEFMSDLSRIVNSASDLIGDVPYTHYSFLGVGMTGGGFGGIEHLNSASLIIGTTKLMDGAEQKENFYSFLAHEYFHTYNVKRIRPIALGPFDYSKENYTNLLWVPEGFTDYYEYLIMRRAGLMSADHVLENYREHIRNYENSTGHLYQSANAASRGIWAQRGMPTERTPEEMAKTISVYDKGCALGMLLDLKIRHATGNQHSLDDVMRALYKDYFQVRKRGFTDHEFQQECERFAGEPLTEIFSYATTVAPVDYPTYLGYAGISIDTMKRDLPGVDIGATVRVNRRDSSLVVTDIVWRSSADTAGLKKGDRIVSIDGIAANGDLYKKTIAERHAGDRLRLGISRDQEVKEMLVVLGTHAEKSYIMTRVDHPTELQAAIYKSWMRVR
jgi:predicted metalloprotease with PDZ domain